MSNLFNYATQGLVVGGTVPSSWLFESIASTPINGVQSSQITLNYPRTETVDWAGGGDPFLAVRPTATLQFSYVFASGTNEGNLGFALNNQTGAASVPALINLNSERNYYLLINQGYLDQIGYVGGNNYVMAFGNGLITQYSMSAAVGQPTTCSVSIEALSLFVQGTGNNNPIPYVNKQSGTFATGIYSFPAFSQLVSNYFEAMPSNIILTVDSGCAIGAILSGNLSCPLQSFGYSMDLSRTASKGLGWAYPDTRGIRWPVTVQIRADAYLNSLQQDALTRFGCPDSGWAFSVNFNGAYKVLDPFSLYFTNAKLNTESISISTKEYDRVSLSWTVSIYDVNRVTGNVGNFFMNRQSQAYNSVIFSNVNQNTGSNSPLTLNLSQPSYIAVTAGTAVLNGNSVSMLNQPGQVTVQLSVSGSTEIDYITAVVR